MESRAVLPRDVVANDPPDRRSEPPTEYPGDDIWLRLVVRVGVVGQAAAETSQKHRSDQGMARMPVAHSEARMAIARRRAHRPRGIGGHPPRSLCQHRRSIVRILARAAVIARVGAPCDCDLIREGAAVGAGFRRLPISVGCRQGHSQNKNKPLPHVSPLIAHIRSGVLSPTDSRRETVLSDLLPPGAGAETVPR